MTAKRKNTEMIEMVETHNIALSIKRMRSAGPYDTDRWKRALYHALGLCDISRPIQEKIRQALELP